MLHVIQVVFAGRAEQPRIFLDQAGAESAYVEQVKNSWKQSYFAYCEQNGVGADSFASAKAFLDTLDLSEKSQINYWVMIPEDAESDTMKQLEGIARHREHIDNLVRQVEQRSGVVREGLSGLLEDLGRLTECFGEADSSPAEVQAVEPKSASAPSPPTAEPLETDGPAEKYKTKEWKTFVGSVMNVCGGNRNECSLFSRHDWRQSVYSDATSLEYWDWVAAKIDRYREKAENAGYTVISDPDSPGAFKIKSPDGTVGETSFYSELDAWCHAGLNLAEPASTLS